MFRADYPSNYKRGGVHIFYKASLPSRILNISNLDFIDPLAKHNEFKMFKSNLEQNLDSLSSCNPFLTVMMGDFHAQTKQWWEIDKTSFEGSELLSSKFDLT